MNSTWDPRRGKIISLNLKKKHQNNKKTRIIFFLDEFVIL